MMDLHKEVITMTSPCSELQRLFDAENKVNNLREDVTEIKASVKELIQQISTLSTNMAAVVMKLDERDRHSLENANTNKTTFERFGTKIDSLDVCIRSVELEMAKNSKFEQSLHTLEKVVYGGGSAIVLGMGSVMLWLIQTVMGK